MTVINNAVSKVIAARFNPQAAQLADLLLPMAGQVVPVQIVDTAFSTIYYASVTRDISGPTLTTACIYYTVPAGNRTCFYGYSYSSTGATTPFVGAGLTDKLQLAAQATSGFAKDLRVWLAAGHIFLLANTNNGGDTAVACGLHYEEFPA